MDLRSIYSFRKDVEELDEDFTAVKNDYQKQLTKIQDAKRQLIETCDHSVVVLLGKEAASSLNDDYAECLCCKECFHLNEDNDFIVEEKNIIDLRNHIPEHCQSLYMGTTGEPVIGNVAGLKLESIAIRTPNATKEEIEYQIIDHVENFVQKREEQLARKREK